MNKLCNTCEYLRYCARSGIEDVGCDRYKKDTTTNEEYLKSCTTEQLAEWIVHIADQCTISHECNRCESWCDEKRVVEWLKQPHSEVAE